MLFNPQIEAAIAHLKAAGCKQAFSMDEHGEVAYKLYPFKVAFRSKSAAQPNSVRIELTPEKHMTFQPEAAYVKLLESSIGPDIVEDGIDLHLPRQKFVRLFHLDAVREAWHGRNRNTETPVGDVVDIIISAAYALKAA